MGRYVMMPTKPEVHPIHRQYTAEYIDKLIKEFFGKTADTEKE